MLSQQSGVAKKHGSSLTRKDWIITRMKIFQGIFQSPHISDLLLDLQCIVAVEVFQYGFVFFGVGSVSIAVNAVFTHPLVFSIPAYLKRHQLWIDLNVQMLTVFHENIQCYIVHIYVIKM